MTVEVASAGKNPVVDSNITPSPKPFEVSNPVETSMPSRAPTSSGAPIPLGAPLLFRAPKALRLLKDLPQGRELVALIPPDTAPLTEVKENGIRFYYNNGLIYFYDANGTQRVCIPRSLYKEIFELAHDGHAHSGFHYIYERIAGLMYLRRLSDSLKQYIQHCPKCQVN